MESQQQENDEVNQDVVTQEPTSPEISVEILRQQEEINPEMDIILDLDLGEDEQMQSQPSGDTEIIEEQIHVVEEMEVTQEQPQQNEEIEGQGSDT